MPIVRHFPIRVCLAHLLVLAPAFVVGVASAADIDKLRLKTGGDVYHLAPFEGVGWMHYFGSFRSRHSSLGGTALDLFPNGRFAIVMFTDISPEVVCKTGDYQVDGTALTLKATKIHTKCHLAEKEFEGLRMVWGQIHEKGYVTGFEVFIFPGDEWKKLNAGSSDVDYMQRRVAYPDWQKLQREYESK